MQGRKTVFIVVAVLLTTVALVTAEESTPVREAVAQGDGMPGANGAELLDYVLNQMFTDNKVLDRTIKSWTEQ